METILTPTNPVVEPGRLLNLVVRMGKELETKQYLVTKHFDYRNALERVRKKGIFKTEEVLEEVTNFLLKGGYITEVKTAELHLGHLGRPSLAQADVYRQKLNSTADNVERVIKALETAFFSEYTRYGDLHILKTEEGHVLGHVSIFVREGEVTRKITLDVIGSNEVDFPDYLRDSVKTKVDNFIKARFPDHSVTTKVFVTRSDLAKSVDYLLGAA